MFPWKKVAFSESIGTDDLKHELNINDLIWKWNYLKEFHIFEPCSWKPFYWSLTHSGIKRPLPFFSVLVEQTVLIYLHFPSFFRPEKFQQTALLFKHGEREPKLPAIPKWPQYKCSFLSLPCIQSEFIRCNKNGRSGKLKPTKY